MKYIEKRPEPIEFIRWKALKQGDIDRKLAEGVSGDVIFSMLLSKAPHPESSALEEVSFYKPDLRKALLEEQGYICCYCNRALKNDHATILEHLNPKGQALFKHQVFDYNNLLACCDGGERDKNKPRETYCTSKKGDLPLEPWFVSPLDTTCETAFEYLENGKIRGKNDVFQKNIDFLGLNAKSLQKLREAAIDTYLFDILEENKDVHSEIQQLKKMVNGRFEPFCMAIIGAIERY